MLVPVGPKKFPCEFVIICATQYSAVPHLAFSVNQISFVVPAFVSLSRCCLSYSKAANCMLSCLSVNLRNKKRSMWSFTIVKGIVYRMFQFHLAINETKTDVCFCEVDFRVAVDGLRVSFCFYILATAYQ